jgi:hypothetical protein
MNDDDAATFQTVITVALEGTTCRTVSNRYYTTLVDTIWKNDPVTWMAFTELFTRIRSKYRSHDEHERLSHLVPMEKCVDAKTAEALRGDCAICLRALYGPSKIARVRASSPNGPETCGHFFHAWCLGALEINSPATTTTCPICRAQLDPCEKYWHDHESTPPKF